MNMRILGSQRKILYVNPMRNMCFDGLIPSVIAGKPMMIMYDEKHGKEEILL